MEMSTVGPLIDGFLNASSEVRPFGTLVVMRIDADVLRPQKHVHPIPAANERDVRRVKRRPLMSAI